jgi:hypothetical protein
MHASEATYDDMGARSRKLPPRFTILASSWELGEDDEVSMMQVLIDCGFDMA